MTNRAKKPENCPSPRRLRKQIPTAAQWLDMMKWEIKVNSDSDVARVLNVHRQSLCHWRQNKHQIGVEDAFYVGKALKINPLYILFCGKYHKADDIEKDKWKKMLAEIEPQYPLKEPTEKP